MWEPLEKGSEEFWERQFARPAGQRNRVIGTTVVIKRIFPEQCLFHGSRPGSSRLQRGLKRVCTVAGPATGPFALCIEPGVGPKGDVRAARWVPQTIALGGHAVVY